VNKPKRVLFLCTGNSARSIFAEYLLRRTGHDRFEVYSAGSYPTGTVNLYAIRVLKDLYHIDASEARGKSWNEYEDVSFELFCALPMDKLNRLKLPRLTQDIGRIE
jgi:arsenate reductase